MDFLTRHSRRPAAPTPVRRFSSDVIYKQLQSKLTPQNGVPPKHQEARPQGAKMPEKHAVLKDTVDSNGVPRNSMSQTPRIQVDAGSTKGEPVIHDFADKYIPKEFQPERPEWQSSGPQNVAHISSLLVSSDDEGAAPPPPDLSRRGIHIPSRTRLAKSID